LAHALGAYLSEGTRAGVTIRGAINGNGSGSGISGCNQSQQGYGNRNTEIPTCWPSLQLASPVQSQSQSQQEEEEDEDEDDTNDTKQENRQTRSGKRVEVLLKGISKKDKDKKKHRHRHRQRVVVYPLWGLRRLWCPSSPPWLRRRRICGSLFSLYLVFFSII